MKQKTIITILAIILVIPLVIATGTITNLSPSIIIPDFIAGDTIETTFSFDYEDDGLNNPDASLVLKVNISSLDEDYPVWIGDFQLSSMIKQYPLFGIPFLEKTIPLKCVEDNAEFRVQQGLLYTETNIPAGTFYCYDPNNYLDMLELDRRDEVTLSISSDPALYPGEYSVEVELMEMQPDYEGPVIELIEPLDGGVFSGYDAIIPIKLNITDMYAIDDSTVRYKIVSFFFPSEGEGLFPEEDISYDSDWIYDIEFNESSGLYEDTFEMEYYGLEESGLYWIYAEAKDILGNEGKL